MLDLIKLKEQLESYPPGPWCDDVKTLAAENEILRGEKHALQVELERLKEQNLINIDSLRRVIALYA